jgi:hypothetical protein
MATHCLSGPATTSLAMRATHEIAMALPSRGHSLVSEDDVRQPLQESPSGQTVHPDLYQCLQASNPPHRLMAAWTTCGRQGWPEVGAQLPNLMAYLQRMQR